MITNNDLCLVTALLDINRGSMQSDFKRSFDHYLECFERLLKAAHDFPMVIYIEPQNENIIWKNRSKDNTRVHHKTKDDLRKFPFYDKIQKIRNDPNWYNQSGWLKESTQGSLPLYNPLVMSKQFLLHDAKLFNHFNSRAYCWIDAGITNTVNIEQYLTNDFAKKLIPHLNKMMFIAFPYDSSTTEVHGFAREAMNQYAGKPTEYVCRGGFFGGNPESISEFNEKYYHLLNDTLNAEKMGSEESIFTLLTYKEPTKYNLRFIDGNGLVYKFFEDIKNEKYEPEPEFPLAFYALTFNTPTEFENSVKSWFEAYPQDFKKNKKYVIDNSTDEQAKLRYRELFKEYNFEIIHEGENIGIQDGRQFAAEHFDKSNHKYYVFWEEDFRLVSPNNPIQNKDGFLRYVPNLFETSIEILENNKLDSLRLTIIEFFGNCIQDWSFKNVSEDKRILYFPERDDGDAELRWKSKVDYLGTHKNIAYAVGHFHYSNWPILFSRKGNHQLFIYDKYEHLYEQTMSALNKIYQMEGKMKTGTIMAAPVSHERNEFYKGSSRRENRHYNNE